MFKIFQKNIDLGDGRIITIETGKLARQADGAVVIKLGRTMLLATVVSSKEAKEDIDFLPLSVDYRENFAAAGRFPGGFFKREGRPSDKEVLTARLVDRALRPLFPEGYNFETFVNIYLISADKEIIPDALAGLAASAALSVSNIPFNGPISEVRIVRINGHYKINPSFSEIEEADIELIVGATSENIIMVEGEMHEVSETDMLEALKFAHEAIKVQCKAQVDFANEIGTIDKRITIIKEDPELKELIFNEYNKFYEIAKSEINIKAKRREAFEAVKEDFIIKYLTEHKEEETDEQLINKYFHDIEKQALRDLLLKEGKRIDGRKADEIRPIYCEVDCLPAAHGSALFTRGETQSLTTVTFGTKLDEKIIDEVLEQGRDKFLLHYNFPPFSTGDARPLRGVSRREVGHGNLANRSLKRMIPTDETINPYSVRVVSDILESNGSSSMATVCAGTLALMDSGLQIHKPVSGIAMGLVTFSSDKYIILSDILGDEDHLGDMDFKVTGTKDGILACQMDIKVKGISFEILAQALEQAKNGRLFILEKMLEVLPEPRPEFKPHAPRVEKIVIAKEYIGAVIGPGGKVIQSIQADTGATIVIEEVDDKGIIEIVASNKESIEAAIYRIKSIVEVPEVGKIYKGVVKGIVSFGAFVEILPGRQGLLHISEIDWKRINTVEDVLKEGEQVEVKLIEIERTGKLRLSRKVLLQKPLQQKPEPPRKPQQRTY
ncbi:MAG: polyribonucleotide nucleotidyltransferase [Bacteroidia bacterium]|nr:polyribonucleotide nucleotidyltransferase [Bacteroidia bacterium]